MDRIDLLIIGASLLLLLFLFQHISDSIFILQRRRDAEDELQMGLFI